MKIELNYGDKSVAIKLPKEQIKNILVGKEPVTTESEEDIVKKALNKPIGTPHLSEIIKKGETVCIIVGDMTRLWVRHHVILPAIIDNLNKSGIPDEDIFIISATGDHRKQTPEEHRLIVGEVIYRRIKVYDHCSRDSENLVYLGTTSHGTPVSINKMVVEASRIILTGGIVYHFLAGWGGGKKSIIPGVAGYETIMKNHSLAFNQGDSSGLNTSVRAGLLGGNPCCDDMEQGAAMVKPDFIVNTIVDSDTHRITGAVVGDHILAHRKGCLYVEEQYGVTISEKAELVIVSCGGYPKDIDFYQTYKTIYNAHFALKKGGTLLLLSECREGLGNHDYERTFCNFTGNSEREADLRQLYTIGGYMAYHAAVIAEENDIIVYSSLPEDTVKIMGMTPTKSLEDAFTFIREKHGKIPECYVIPQGGAVFPIMSK